MYTLTSVTTATTTPTPTPTVTTTTTTITTTPAAVKSVLMETDGSEALGGAYWAEKCKEVPSDATMILIQMGSVMDYYRPGPDNTWCGMLATAGSKKEFSRDGVNWMTPAAYGGTYGGSTDVPDAS